MSRSADKFFPIEGMMRAGRVKMMVLCFVVVAVAEVLDGSSRRWDECRVKMLVLCSNCNSGRSSSYSSSSSSSSSSSRRRMSAGPAQNVGALQ